MSEINLSFALDPNPPVDRLAILFGGSSQTHPGHNWGPTVHDYYLIHYIDAGCGTFRCNGVLYELGAGDSFFIFPGVLIHYWADASLPWRYRWIAFRGEPAAPFLRELGISPESPVLRQMENNRRIRTIMHTVVLLLKENQPNMRWSAAAYLQLLFAEYALAANAPDKPSARKSKPIARQIELAIQWIKLQYYKPLSIEDISKQLGYHRTHFSKMFKSATGLSPMQYLQQVRMEQAKPLLGGPLSVQQVAAAVGFNDPLHFSKQFKRKYGVTPSEYRSQQE